MNNELAENTNPERDARLDDAIAEYFAAIDSGVPVRPEAWLAKYPDLVGELAAFLDDQSQVGRFIGSDEQRTSSPAPKARDRSGASPMAEGETSSLSPRSGRPQADGPPRGTLIGYFGDFELIRILGRGGMGVVYLGHQISLDRPVALKMISSGRLADDEELRRFRNEGEAVARLDHPNILSIFEVGEHDGHPYFSMPLIVGGSLADHPLRYLEDPWKGVRLLADVADGIDHAHQRGILHRDLKPANILVGESERPLIGDFGLSKRLDNQGDTSVGVIGTPAYMAPEQASRRRGMSTTACDVYGLGAILYALLTGRPPFEGDTVTEVMRRVTDDPPVRPSKLNRRVDRRLESVCLKCLEKEPRRRYSSAAMLAEDLRRWLAGEPVQARPANVAVRLGLWCRRKPVLATLGLLLLVSIVTGGSGVAWHWAEASHQRLVTRHVDRYFREAFLGYNDPLGFAHDRASIDIHSLDMAVDRIGRRFVELPEVEAGIREAIGNTYRALGRPDRAESQLRISLDLRRNSPTSDQVGLEVARREYSSLLIALGRLDEGGRLAKEALEGISSHLGPSHTWTLLAKSTVAQWHLAAGRPKEAETLLRDVLLNNRKSAAHDPKLAIVTLGDLGIALQADGRAEEAEGPLKKCLDEVKANGIPDDHPLALNALNSYAAFLIRQDRHGQAAATLERVMKSDRWKSISESPEALTILSNWVVVCYKTQRFDDAKTAAVEALRGQERLLRPSEEQVLNNRRILADLAIKAKDWAGAVVQYEQIARSRPEGATILPAIDTSETAQHAEALCELGKFAEARRLLEGALPRFRARATALPPPGEVGGREQAEARKDLGRNLSTLGMAMIESRADVDAESVLREAVSIRSAVLPKGNWRTANSENLLGQALSNLGRMDEAERKLLESFKILSGPDTPPIWVDRARQRLADFYDARGRPDQADRYRKVPSTANPRRLN
jgi:eukaryotic-like serine/threonine-protein kinase